MGVRFIILATLLLFNQLSLAGTHGLAPAATTCNIITGIAIGTDAGTCASPHATCNGIADDTAAFTAFNTWAKATTANSGSLVIELDITGHCLFATGNVNEFLSGIKNARLMGYGATLSGTVSSSYSLGGSGVCQAGLSDPSGCSARLATVLSGASSVTLLDTSRCSRFVAGRWAVVTGFDLQGIANIPFGYPPNPHYFDYVQILSTSNCATTGQITFGSALTNSYLSTWPNYNSGNANEADAGGPATIYALSSTWDTNLDIRGITIDQIGQTLTIGRSVIFRDIAVTGSNCLIPSQNSTYSIVNGAMIGCTIEVDKIIGTYSLTNVTATNVVIQSSSVNVFNVSNSTLDVGGTPKVANITNSTIGNLSLGPTSYGRADSATCTNCNITTSIRGFGYQEKASADVGVNFYYSMASGVINAPDSAIVTGFANNGSGLVRLTIASTTGWTTNALSNTSGVFVSGPDVDSNHAITIIDGTHIDLQGSTFSGDTWSGSGTINNTAPRWAIPGTNVFWGGSFTTEASAFQVSGVTQNASGTHITTSNVSGFPTLPLSSGKLFLSVQMPKWTCSGCTGIADAIDFAGAPANIPIYSYSKRVYVNATALTGHSVLGKVNSIKFNVTQAYTGSTNPLKFESPSTTVIPTGTTSVYDPFIDLRTAGIRTITSSGVTCNTGGGPIAGGCGADSGLTLPDAAAFFSSMVSPAMASSPIDQPWSMSVEYIMDQGVIP